MSFASLVAFIWRWELPYLYDGLKGLLYAAWDMTDELIDQTMCGRRNADGKGVRKEDREDGTGGFGMVMSWL